MHVIQKWYGYRIWRISAAKVALHDDINILVCEINSKWSFFSDVVTYACTCTGASLGFESRVVFFPGEYTLLTPPLEAC